MTFFASTFLYLFTAFEGITVTGMNEQRAGSRETTRALVSGEQARRKGVLLYLQ